jgi:hypothetical protein
MSLSITTQVAVAGCLAVLCATASHAGTTSFQFVSTISGSHGTLGQYSGSMTFSHAGGTSATLSVTLKNLETTAAGGKITGFVFGAPSISGLTFALVSVPSIPNANRTWQIATGRNAAANPFGMYALGAAIGGNFLRGGSPNTGLAVGETGTWVFSVTGSESSLASIVAADFWSANEFGFVARFRGFADGGSDKTPGVIIPLESLVVVPVPAPVLLAGAGLLIGVAARRRFTRGY